MRFSWLDQLLRRTSLADDGRPASGNRVYRLASDLAETSFVASIQVQWLPGEPAHEAPLFQYLGQESNRVTRRFSVLDTAAAQDALNSSFAALLGEVSGAGVQLVSARAALEVEKDDLNFAERKASIQRQTALDAASLESTQARLTMLRDLFLNDSAMAGLWWFNGEPDRLLQLEKNAGTFEKVVSMVAESHAGAAKANKIAGLIECFLADLGPDHRELLIAQLDRIFTSYQRPELSEELQRAG